MKCRFSRGLYRIENIYSPMSVFSFRFRPQFFRAVNFLSALNASSADFNSFAGGFQIPIRIGTGVCARADLFKRNLNSARPSVSAAFGSNPPGFFSKRPLADFLRVSCRIRNIFVKSLLPSFGSSRVSNGLCRADFLTFRAFRLRVLSAPNYLRAVDFALAFPFGGGCRLYLRNLRFKAAAFAPWGIWLFRRAGVL